VQNWRRSLSRVWASLDRGTRRNRERDNGRKRERERGKEKKSDELTFSLNGNGAGEGRRGTQGSLSLTLHLPMYLSPSHAGQGLFFLCIYSTMTPPPALSQHRNARPLYSTNASGSGERGREGLTTHPASLNRRINRTQAPVRAALPPQSAVPRADGQHLSACLHLVSACASSCHGPLT